MHKNYTFNVNTSSYRWWLNGECPSFPWIRTIITLSCDVTGWDHVVVDLLIWCRSALTPTNVHFLEKATVAVPAKIEVPWRRPSWPPLCLVLVQQRQECIQYHSQQLHGLLRRTSFNPHDIEISHWESLSRATGNNGTRPNERTATRVAGRL